MVRQQAGAGRAVVVVDFPSANADSRCRDPLFHFLWRCREGSDSPAFSAQLHGILCQRLLPAVAGGRALLTEYFSNEASSRRLIAEGRMSELQDFISRGDPRSARSFADSLLKLVRDGIVAEAVALENADNPQEFTRTLRGISSSMQATRR